MKARDVPHSLPRHVPHSLPRDGRQAHSRDSRQAHSRDDRQARSRDSRQAHSRGALAAAIAALLLAAPAPVAAQAPKAASPAKAPEGHEGKAAAQTLFDQAMALRKKGAHEEACVKLAESQRLDPAPGTKFYLAECLEQIGKLASAWTLYTEVADEMATTGQKKREAFARERSAALAPRLARVTIVVPDAVRAPGLVVRRGGVLVGEAQWGVAVPVDPGTHTIEAAAPDRAPFSKTVDVREPGATRTVVLPPWRARPSPSAPPATSPDATAPIPGSTAAPGPAGSKATSMSPLRVAGLALGGLGVAGLAAGAALGGLAIAKKDESNAGPCDAGRDVCSPEGLALRSDAITAATGSTVAFVVSGVLLAAGATLVVLPMTGALRTSVVVRPDRLGLEGRW